MKSLLYPSFFSIGSFLKLNQKKMTLIIILMSIATGAFSQSDIGKKFYLKLSCGQVSFGTGDFLGYSFGVEASKDVLKKTSFALGKLLIGGELIFENGVKNPVLQNPSADQFFSKTFNHVSNTVLWTKISYYPLRKFLSGFNIQLGPAIAYSYRSTEQSARRTVDASGQATRISTLYFNNDFSYGYRISTGIEFNIGKKYLTGFRLDFSNNNIGEINTLVGIKAGVKL